MREITKERVKKLLNDWKKAGWMELISRYNKVFDILPLKSSKAPTNYFTPNILRKSWSRVVVSVVHLDALAFPVAAT